MVDVFRRPADIPAPRERPRPPSKDGSADDRDAVNQRRVELPPHSLWEVREGAGTAVVLIHGLGGSADWWRRNIEPLATEHLVAAVELVGFGRNRLFLRRTPLPLALVEVAALLARWIESSFDGPVHVVGNSMGGQVAVHLAARRPDLVRSLTLVNSTGIPFEIKPGLHLGNLVVPRGALSFSTILARDAFRSGPASLALAFARLLRDDARPLMRELRVPVLVLWGESDPLVPLAYGRRIAEEIPHAKLVVIPRAGHIPMWENAAAFNHALLAFLREVDAASPPADDRRLFSWAISGWTGGMAHRQAGAGRDIVLVHGLGMSSVYFGPLARALFERGFSPAAPDLPGFGSSVNAPATGVEEHARLLAAWSEALGIRDAVWVGHSIGCNAVAQLRTVRPDLCRATVHIGPLWTEHPHPALRLLCMLLLDGLREPLRLFRFVIPVYWRAGLLRWLRTFRRYEPDLRAELPGGVMIAGERDPLLDRNRLVVTPVPGAHACHFSHPDAVAEAVIAAIRMSRN